MGIWSRLFGSEKKSSSLDYFRSLNAAPSASGKNVTPENAINVTAVLACVRCLADGVSQVPLKLMRQSEDGRTREPARDHPLYELLHSSPNNLQTSYELREQLMFHVALTGNFLAYKNIVGGSIVELIPFEPKSYTIAQNPLTLEKVFKVKDKNGIVTEYSDREVWHLKGPSWDAIKGLEPVKLARDAIGLAMATEEHHSALHRNGSRPGGAVSVSGRMGDAEYARYKEWISETYSGSQNSFKTMVFDRDAKFMPFAMTGVDAQHLETRRFQIEEICRAFRVMPIMAGYSDKAATYASAEQMFLAHVVYTLAPWYERIEQSMAVSLLTEEERAAGLYPKFFANGLMRGAAADRASFYSSALGSGGSPAWITPNEVRELEDMNPKVGGDDLPAPTNVAPQPAPTAPAGGNQ